MATVSEKPADLAVPEWAASSVVDEKVDRYLAARLRAVGADYKSVALTTFLLAAGVGLMTWLAFGVLADHWIVPGGLGRGSRLAWLVVGGVALLAAIARWVAPLIRYRVNLVYAARTIERANPGLHNDVVNTVLARARPDRSPPVVLASLEHRAAKRLSKLPADVVADRSAALRLAVVLAALVAALCLYAVLSPKSLATSLARLAAPLARIQPPTRVQIDEPMLAWKPSGDRAAGASARPLVVVDGATTMIRNRQLVVASRIRGLQDGERPVVEATAIADDGSFERGVSWLVGMEPTKDGTFEARLPAEGRGLGHSLGLAIVAGDARSEPLRVTVVDEPSLLVREVRLVYPSYTRREPETLEWQGDVSGPEGTRVTLSAESNEPLDGASIDFACDGKSLLKMRIDPKDLARASGSFDLRMAADGSGPWEREYQLVFTPRLAGNAGDAKLAGIAHRIDVIADKVPEVRIVVPEKAVMKVPPREPVVVGVEARDPDHGLRSVVIELELERSGERMPREAVTVLDRDLREPFSGRGSIVPSSVGAVAGDTLHYRAVATDVKTPSPNVAHTKWYSLEIDPAAPPARNPPSAAVNDAGGGNEDGDGDEKQDGGSGEDAREGDDKRKGEGKGGENAEGQDPGGGSSGGGESEGGSSQGRGANEQQGRSGDSNGNSNEGEKQQGAKQGEGETGSGPPEQGDAGEKADGAGKTPGSSSPSKSGEDGKRDAAEGSQPASDDAGKGGGNDPGKQGQGEQGQGEKPNAGEPQGGTEGAPQGGAEGQGRQRGQPQGKEQGQRQQAADAASNAEKDPSRPVASDGTNDGEAIERILEQRRGEGQEGEPKQDGTQKNDAGDQKDAAAGNPDGQTEKNEGHENEGHKKDGAKEQGQQPEGQNQQGEKKQGEPQPNGECRPEEGKPCGGADCPTCKGGGSKSGGGGGAGSSGGSKQGEAAAPSGKPSASGEPSAGEPSDGSAGSEGSRKPGQGEAGGGEPSDSGQPAADREGTESGGAEADPRGGKPGGSKQDGSKEGASQEGESQKDGAGEKPDQAGDAKPGSGRPGGAKPGEGQAGGDRPGDAGEGAPGEDLASDDPASDRKPSDQPGAGGRAGRGFGGWNADEKSAAPDGAAASKDAEWGEQDLSHARNAVDLAVEHLRRSVEEGRTDVIDSLGWTREQAQAFLDRWARIARDAKEGGPKKQEEFDRAVRSLGLTPAGVRRTREPPPDARGGQAEGRRSRPPFEYREQFEAFTRGSGNR